MSSEKTSRGVVFYNDDAKKSHQMARQFCRYTGQGRLATVTDVIDLRLSCPDRLDPIWSTFFSTISAEYYGRSKGGNPLVIVTHGIGPLCNEERLETGEVIDGEFVLSKKEFLDLESGKYGCVDVFDYTAKEHLFENPYGISTLEETLSNEFAMARLGPKGEELLRRIMNMYAEEFKDHTGDNRCVFNNESIYRWTFQKGINVYRGNFLTFDPLQKTHHWRGNLNLTSLVTGIDNEKSLHFGGRFIGIEGNEKLAGLEKDYLEIFQDLPANLERLLIKEDGKHKTNTPYPIKLIGNQWFTVYLTENDSMLSGPQYKITKIKKVKGPTHIKVKCNPSGVFLCAFELREIQKRGPPDANAFSIGDVGVKWKVGDVGGEFEGLKYNYADKHIIPLTFYQVEVDTSRRILRYDEVKNNFQNLMMALKK